MSSSFSKKDQQFKLELVRNENAKAIENADEIMDAIKHCRYEINERLLELEEMPQTKEIDKEIAILIRQDQYLGFLEGKQKYELADMFLSKKYENNCIVPEILNWYQGN